MYPSLKVQCLRIQDLLNGLRLGKPATQTGCQTVLKELLKGKDVGPLLVTGHSCGCKTFWLEASGYFFPNGLEKFGVVFLVVSSAVEGFLVPSASKVVVGFGVCSS